MKLPLYFLVAVTFGLSCSTSLASDADEVVYYVPVWSGYVDGAYTHYIPNLSARSPDGFHNKTGCSNQFYEYCRANYDRDECPPNADVICFEFASRDAAEKFRIEMIAEARDDEDVVVLVEGFRYRKDD